MRTKIVYALVSDSSDYYLEQALISLHSLRKFENDVIVELVVDEGTLKTLVDKRSKITEYVSSIVKVVVPSFYDKRCRSRFLKTNLRGIVQGDYLFIDCDTVICGKLDEIDTIEGELAAVADVNGPLPLSDDTVISRCESAGFPNLAGQPYYNSGVMLVRDSALAHQFYEKWFMNWQASVSNGVFYDQPSLCYSNVQMGKPIRELSGIWNCQFKYRHGFGFLKEALIMHYFNAKGTEQWSLPSNCILQSVKDAGLIDNTIDQLLLKPKSRLYSIMTVSRDGTYDFFNSEMLDIYLNYPALYRFVLSFAQSLKKSFAFLSKLKTIFFR